DVRIAALGNLGCLVHFQISMTKPIAAILLAGLLFNQQTEPIRVNVRLVEVHVVAVNKSGTPVTDLTKDDFEIVDNGKVQEIRIFSLEQNRLPVAALPLPNQVFSNRTLGAVKTAPGVSVVLFDLLNTEFAD